MIYNYTINVNVNCTFACGGGIHKDADLGDVEIALYIAELIFLTSKLEI
jgi:hypothetical protein